MTELNWVSLVKAWQDGEISLEEAVSQAKDLPVPARKTDPDGTSWYDGEIHNTALALEAFYSFDVIQEFLEALAKVKE